MCTGDGVKYVDEETLMDAIDGAVSSTCPQSWAQRQVFAMHVHIWALLIVL